MWRSLVAHLTGGQGAAGSNPVIPTQYYTERMTRRRHNSPLVRVVKKYRTAWAWITVVLYVVAVPITVWVFPANSMWLGLLVLFSGLTASLATLADLLVNAEEADDGE